MRNDANLIKEGLRQRRKQRAQSLTEFALILPVLLFFIMGIIDFGRVLFTYAQASAQIRAALRYASIVGYSTPIYLDCDLMRQKAQQLFFSQGAPTVTITYSKADTWNGTTFATVYPTANNPSNCVGDGTPTTGSNNNLLSGETSDLENGDILRVSSNISIAMMTPFFPSPMTFTLAGQRTLVTDIELIDAPYQLTAPSGAIQTADFQTFVAQLSAATNAAASSTSQFNTQSAAETATNVYMLTEGIPTLTWTPSPTGASPTPVLAQVQNLTWWPAGAKCVGVDSKKRPGLVWTKLTGVQGYYIYANNVLVGKTTDNKGKIRQCGRSVSASSTGRISGCFNLNPGAWTPGVSIDYQVAAYTANGTVIGPLSNVLTKTC